MAEDRLQQKVLNSAEEAAAGVGHQKEGRKDLDAQKGSRRAKHRRRPKRAQKAQKDT